MEEFFFWDDRPAYPCDFFVRLRFAGCLDRTGFEKAVRVAMARHPLLTAKVKTVGRRLWWAGVDDWVPVLHWETSPCGGPLPPATHLDLREEIGVRFHVRVDAVAATCDLTIQFHHACCDAGGSATFIRDLLLAYAAICAGTEDGQIELPPLDPALLAGRGRFGLGFGKLLRMAPRQLVGLLGARQFLMRRPVPLFPHQVFANDSPLPAGFPATLSHTFDPETTVGVRRAADALDVTPNDLLARDLFLTLADWRLQRNVREDDDWLRMMVPINLRTPADRLLPAADVVSTVFLDRRTSDSADPDRLLRGIHAEMDRIKRNQLGFTFIGSLAVCRLFGGLERQVRADKCTVSCVFTNVGTLFAQTPLPEHQRQLRAGNVTLSGIDCVAPIHPYSCVSVAAGLYGGSLNITLHYDPRPLDQQQAADLLTAYVRRITASTAVS